MNRLLIVDDDPAWRALYRMSFESQFDVFEASDAPKALALLEQVNPDVILLDLRMPKMDGLDFIRRLNLKGISVPIVVCSGALRDGERLALPGVQTAPKTPDLRDLWMALRAAVPGSAEATGVATQVMTAEDTYWRD
jgi:CheY-like chemotaxis protein